MSTDRKVVVGACFPKLRSLKLAGRDASTRVAASRGYVLPTDFYTHNTKPGENLHFIGLDYGVSVEALRNANGLRHSTGDVIYEGQEIRIPVIETNRQKIELIRAKQIVARENANAKAAAERAKKQGNTGKTGTNKKGSTDVSNNAWRAPYRGLKKSQVTAVSRAEVEQMLPEPGPSLPGLEHARGLRDADVLLLVEMPECEWCGRVRPTWRKLAETQPAVSDVRVCSFLASTPEDRAWADTHLAAHAFPTVIAMPKRGGVYKYAGVDRDLPKLKAFADAAFKTGAPLPAMGKQSQTHLGSSALEALAPSIAVADAVERALVNVVGAKPAAHAADAVATTTPFVLFGFGVGLFVNAIRKALANMLPSRSKRNGPGSYYESGVGGPGGSAQAAAARLDASGFGGVAAEDFPVPTNLSGEPIAPAAAERYKSAREAERVVLENERRRVMEERAQQRDDGAIPKGASVEKLGEWILMVESELGDIARRFFFLCGAWFRLQKRLWGARFAPPPRESARADSEAQF